MELIETGKIVGAHGVSGEMKVQAWADNLDIMLGFKYIYIDNRRFELESAKIHKNAILYRLFGVDNLNKAELLRNKIIFVDKAEFKLEEGCYFIKDLLEVNVIDIDSGLNYGIITDVFKTGVHDVYEVTDKEGVIRLIPAIKDCVIETNITDRIMKIRPLEGLFE